MAAMRYAVGDLRAFLDREYPILLVEILEAKGSSPREAGTFMLVSPTDSHATIGGGQMEFMAIDHARAILAGMSTQMRLDIPLGPEIGQCCGGRVTLGFSRLDETGMAAFDARIEARLSAMPEVWLFGAGHVGRALGEVLALLPVKGTVVETRASELALMSVGVRHRLAAMPEALVAEAAPGAAIVILTHDHALDFLIAREALARDDLAYVGMIGSKTKRATFASQARESGLGQARIDRLVLPIGGRQVPDKRPAVIAAMTAAELLVALSSYRSQGSS